MPQPPKQLTEEQILKAKQKEERRLEFEAKRAAEQKNKTSDSKSNKSKTELKKERRDKQEAQRAAKQQISDNKPPQTNDVVDFCVKSIETKESLLPDSLKLHATDSKSPLRQRNAFKETIVEQSIATTITTKQTTSKQPSLTRPTKSSPISSNKKDQIFVHIPKRETDLNELTKGLGYNGEHIHSSIIRIGLKMNQNLIIDPTNRCIAFLVALKSAIQDYVQPSSKQISRDLEHKLDLYVSFLKRCRPLSVSMRNVIRIMRSYISKLNPELKLEEAKKHLIGLIEKFLYEEVECGLDGIREHGNLKINQGDVILTFGNSFLIKHIFKEAKKSEKQFRVIVVDSHPRLEGKKLIEFLHQQNIEVTYVLISALSYVMKEVNKVLIEAHTLLANGYMVSDMGSSQIALVAKSHNVPVLICCETYKFSERVHTDSFVFNEADPAQEFLTTHNENSDLRKFFSAPTTDDRCGEKSKNLNILNLYYDITPCNFINLVITEIGVLPATAVPVIIRRNISKFQLD